MLLKTKGGRKPCNSVRVLLAIELPGSLPAIKLPGSRRLHSSSPSSPEHRQHLSLAVAVQQAVELL
jgi:hypothetical protein